MKATIDKIHSSPKHNICLVSIKYLNQTNNVYIFDWCESDYIIIKHIPAQNTTFVDFQFNIWTQ